MGKWSDELIEKTRSEAYEGAMMKNLNGNYGMISSRSASGVKIVGVKTVMYMPVPTSEVIAEYPNFNAMIEDGWAID